MPSMCFGVLGFSFYFREFQICRGIRNGSKFLPFFFHAFYILIQSIKMVHWFVVCMENQLHFVVLNSIYIKVRI